MEAEFANDAEAPKLPQHSSSNSRNRTDSHVAVLLVICKILFLSAILLIQTQLRILLRTSLTLSPLNNPTFRIQKTNVRSIMDAEKEMDFLTRLCILPREKDPYKDCLLTLYSISPLTLHLITLTPLTLLI